MALAASASFPGIDVVIGADMTFGHGISPSVCTIRTVPHSNFIAGVGTLVLSFGGDSLKFKDCALDLATLRADESGTEWTINILDRRWKWAFGHVSGKYNTKKADGEIDKDTEKTPQELAKLLLEAMGETRPDVSALPSKPRPEVQWDFDNPAAQLAELCDSLSCRVVLGLDDRVKIHELGKGARLPTGGVSAGGAGFDTSAIPSSLMIVGAPIRFQSKWLLEAVGEDTDGSIKLLDDLSYKPADGFICEGMTNVDDTYLKDGVEAEAYELAAKSVYRWYRVKEQAAGGGFTPPGYDGKPKITKLKQIVWGDGLIGTVDDPDGRKVPKPAEVSAEWYTYSDDDFTSEPGAPFRAAFSFDSDKGIVRFANPVYILDASASNAAAAEVYLTISYTLLDEGGTPIRFTRERKIPEGKKANTKPRIILHEEIERTVKQNYSDVTTKSGAPVDNLQRVNKEADHYIDAVLKEYTTDQSLTQEYAGLVFLAPDGLTTQVSWRMGNGQPATTTISQVDEHDIYTPSYSERRKEEQAKFREEFNAKVNKSIKDLAGRVKKFFGFS